MASVSTGTVFYRKTASSGSPETQTLATLKTDLDLTGTNSGDQTITLAGDVTGSGTGSFTATISDEAVSNAKLAHVASARIKGRVTASTGDVEDLTGTEATTLLDVFTDSLKGLRRHQVAERPISSEPTASGRLRQAVAVAAVVALPRSA